MHATTYHMTTGRFPALTAMHFPQICVEVSADPFTAFYSRLYDYLTTLYQVLELFRAESGLQYEELGASDTWDSGSGPSPLWGTDKITELSL